MYTTKTKLKYAKQLRRHQTRAEKSLGYLYLLGFSPQRLIGGYIVDWYNPIARVGIEVDGSVHNNKLARAKDKRRTKHLRGKRVYIMRVSNDRAQKQSYWLLIEIIMTTIIWFFWQTVVL